MPVLYDDGTDESGLATEIGERICRILGIAVGLIAKGFFITVGGLLAWILYVLLLTKHII